MFLNVLVIRFSAFGDVAMSVPTVYSVAKTYPNHTFYVLTSESFAVLFKNQQPNIKVIGVDLNQYKGLNGMFSLARFIRKGYDIDMVADLHNVLRSKFLRFYFKLYQKTVKYIDKDRAKKNAITKHKAPLVPLRHTIDRYLDVFGALNLPCKLNFTSYFDNISRNIDDLNDISFDISKINIGFAPFAKHKEKMYPIDKMEEVVKRIASLENTQIYLFGGGDDEKQRLEEWDLKYTNVKSVVGQLTLEKELLLISYLSVIVTMDSANMHLASLVNTPVVSVWGATHPYLGFYGYKQLPENAVQIELDCRPCSVFGDVPCWRGDHACMEWLPPKLIIDKVEKIVINHKLH